MRSVCKRSNIGFAMMIGSPVLALGLGWEAFFPVALCSMICAATLLIGKSLSTLLTVGQLTAELVEDLVSADVDRRDLVLEELKPLEAQLFLAELPRARAKLQQKKERNAGDCCANVRWAWRIQY